MVKACIFDLDGTLLNTLQDLTDAVNYALTLHHFPQRTLNEVKSFVGNGVAVLMKRAVPAGTNEKEEMQCLEDFKQYYEKHKEDKTCLYEGIYDMLIELHKQGIQLAIVSNKFDQAVKELNHHYFGDLIGIAIGESPVIKRKPAPDTVYMALKELGVGKDEVLYIGDSETDVMTAENAQVPFVGVTWGFREEAVLRKYGAKRFIHIPLEILEFLK